MPHSRHNTECHLKVSLNCSPVFNSDSQSLDVKFSIQHYQWHATAALGCTVTTHHTTTVLRPFFRDHPGEPVPGQHFWTLWCKGRLTEADTPTIRLGATPSGLTSAHIHHPPQIFLQAGCRSCRPTNSVKALKATSAFRLGRRRKSSPQWCYLHRLHILLVGLS